MNYSSLVPGIFMNVKLHHEYTIQVEGVGGGVGVGAGRVNFPPIALGNKTVEGLKISYPIVVPPVSVETRQWKYW